MANDTFDGLTERDIREVESISDAKCLATNLLYTLDACRAERDAERARAERAEAAVRALYSQVIVYHDSDEDFGIHQCIDCRRTISLYYGDGSKLEHSPICDVGELLQEHREAIAAARAATEGVA